MSTTIPGAPNGGGALASYLDEYVDEIDWIPSPNAGISKEIEAALQNDFNDPNNWFAYAANSLQTVWNSLPENVRQEAQIAIGQLINLGLQNLGSVSTNALSTSISGMADVIPLIGAIIESLISAVQDLIELGKDVETKREDTAAGHFMDSSRWTIEQYDDPNAWVMKRAKVVNFLDRYDGKWRVRPSFGRSGGNATRMFYGSSGPPDSGFCGAGVRMDCGLAPYQSMATCEKHDPNNPYCERHVPISCLFYPFYSAAYPDRTAVTELARLTGGWGETEGKITYTPVTANSLLMSRQMALLSSPSANLRVNAKELLKFRNRFVNYFYQFANAFAPENIGKNPSPEYFGVLPVNNHHITQRVPANERLTIDLEKGPLPSTQAQNQFYFDDDGLIHSYHTANLNEWGVPALTGPQTPKDVAVTIAQYNTVVSATLSFMSARANFLRNGPMMRVLLQDFGASSFDKKVRAAMRYSADVGEKLPRPSRAKPAPKRPLPTRLLAVPILPSGLLPSGSDVAIPPPSTSKSSGLTRNEATVLALAAGGLAAWKGPELVQYVRKAVKRRRRR